MSTDLTVQLIVLLPLIGLHYWELSLYLRADYVSTRAY